MNKTVRYLLYTIPAVAGAIVIYALIKNNQSKKSATAPMPALSGTQPTVTVDLNFPLKQGSRGDLVKQLQKALGGLSVDGIFGPLTEAALVAKTGKKTVDSRAEFNQITNQ